MASVSSLSGSSSSSSIYGNRTYNIISGLASGLDTEELISGLVQSYQQKIQSLQNKNTKYQWQQQAIQSISDKLVEFDRNYTSYVYSNTNLFSSSFFNNAVITSTNGTNSALISASGKSSSDVVINAVKQLATAARYTTDSKIESSTTGTQMENLAGDITLSKLSGSLTIKYGNTAVDISFGERELFEKTNADGTKSFDAEAFKNAITEKLSEQQITTSSGTTLNANDVIGVDVQEDGSISFWDKSGSGNKVSIGDATGNLANMIPNLKDVVSNEGAATRIDVSGGVTEDKPTAEFLSGKSITVTLDGKSATFQLSKLIDTSIEDQEQAANAFVDALNKELKNTFGTSSSDPSQNRVSVSLKDGGLSFTTAPTNGSTKGSTLSVTASNEDVGSVLGIGSGLTNYVDTTKTLGELGIITGDEKQDLIINGVTIGSYDKNTELNTILNSINSNTEAGVNVSYSKTTNQFVFTAKETGSGGRIEFDGTLGKALFAPDEHDPSTDSSFTRTYSYEPGQDAIVDATINGQSMQLTRSSNSFDLDGMNITLNGTFEAKTDADKVTFTSKTDADTIVDAVKKMVDDMNAIIKEVKNAYSTMPLEKSDGSKYEPLTDEDKEGMSDSAIESYEEKAKTGILFMDSDLSSLYNDLRNVITSSGADGVTLRSMGISTSYSDGLTTITFDEKAFREALENDPDKVQEAFTKSKDSGAATDGLMASFKKITDKYASTTGTTKGILIEKAGSKYSPSAALDNTLLNQMKDIEDQISEWQDKMSNKVDYYTNKFTQLEMLMNQMNSQSSALAGLMGG